MSSTRPYRDLMRLTHRATLLGDRVGERVFTEQLGVGRALFLVLRTIAEAGPSGADSQQQIAVRLSLTKGTVSRHVATAAAQGWLTVQASPVSQREHALVLTAAGQALLERGLALQQEREHLADSELDPDDVAAAVRTLTIICQLLEREDQQ
jgi:DNA-binding MarR family transcriptional regulator